LGVVYQSKKSIQGCDYNQAFHAPEVSRSHEEKKIQPVLVRPKKGKPGQKGPTREVINAVVIMKQRNPRYGCPRIAQQINAAFNLTINEDIVRRILQLTKDSGCSPPDIDGPHFTYQPAQRAINGRSAWFGSPALPIPISAKACSMPANNCIRVQGIQCNTLRESSLNLENHIQNNLSAIETRGRLTDRRSIATCCFKAIFSMAKLR